MMSSRTLIAALVAAAGLAVPAMGQDSVSPTPGLANVDALSSYNTTEQLNTFVVDLQDITSSWGNTFGIAPLFKSSRVAVTPGHPGNFPNVNVSHSVVSNMTVQRTAPFASYSLWTGPGAGVNDGVNTAGTPTTVGGQTFQLAAAFAEFGFTDGGPGTEFEWNGIIGGTINYTAADPKRLYVARAQYAASGRNNLEELAQFGLGAIDATGNAYFRADNFGTPVTPNRVQGQNIYRVRLLSDGLAAGRDFSVVNAIDDNINSALAVGDGPAVDWIVQRSGTTHNVPNAIPQERGLGVTRPVYAGATFGGNYAYEFAALSTVATPAHRGAFLDHRSPSSFSQAAFFPGTVGTKGLLLQNELTITKGVWGVDANGAVAGTRQFTLPASITDNDPAATFTIPLVTVVDLIDGSVPYDAFDHYRGTTAFRGGPSVGVGSDQQGNLLTTGVVYLKRPSAFATAGSATLANWGFNGISVARINAPASAEAWTWAAFVVPNPAFNPLDPNPNNRNPVRGKPFYNAMGETVGELRPFFELGTTATGPSMSAGAVDSVGNVWFVAVYDRYNEFGDLRGTPTSGLFRTVYDGATFSYKLELVLNNGAEIRGRNSDRDYKIIFLGLTNTNGGASSDGLFASSVNQSTWAGANAGSLATSDPRTLGGLALKASIIYDVNGDGEFISLTGAQGNPLSPDQNYQVVLFLGGAAAGDEPVDCNGNGIDDAVEIAGGARDCFNPLVMETPNSMGGSDGVLDECQCVANWNRDGAVNSNDISAFISSWLNAVGGGPANADVNCDGFTNSNDISAFISVWLSAVQNTVPFDGCP